MAAIQTLFLVMFVALAAGPRAEAILGVGDLLERVLHVNGTAICPAYGTIIGTSHPVSNGSLVELECTVGIFGTGKPCATTYNNGLFSIVTNLLDDSLLPDILIHCNLVIRDLSTVCNTTQKVDGVLRSALKLVGTVNGLLGKVYNLALVDLKVVINL